MTVSEKDREMFDRLVLAMEGMQSLQERYLDEMNGNLVRMTDELRRLGGIADALLEGVAEFRRYAKDQKKGGAK